MGRFKAIECDWIICSQAPEVTARHPGPLVRVNVCLRCGAEEAIKPGPMEATLKQSVRFIETHGGCKEVVNVAQV